MLRIDADNPELSRAQLEVLSRQIPLLYFILVVNAAALTITHAVTAPAILAIHLPSLLAVACAARVVAWRRTRGTILDDQAVVARLRLTFRLVCVLCAAWALSLAFYMSITVIGCIFCPRYWLTRAINYLGPRVASISRRECLPALLPPSNLRCIVHS